MSADSLAQQTDIFGQVGSGAFGTQVVALPNGNIVVTDPSYDAPGPIVDVGAVYVYNGSTGALQSIFTGRTAGDQVGSGGITVLANGNFVISSPNWTFEGATKAGAVTWASGSIGGVVSPNNSLVGSNTDDQVGLAVQALPNGNYVVSSPFWDNGTVVNAGAVTFGNGTQGVASGVSAFNSLVGSSTTDFVGFGALLNGITVLPNGNYVVSSPSWSNGATSNVGAATWGSGTTGISGVVSPANSLVGSAANDNVGLQGILFGPPVSAVLPLTNGNYIVGSPSWDNGGASDAGAVTFGNGTTGISGTISSANSLIGSTASDQVGSAVSSLGLTALTNGNYVVTSTGWDGPASNIGAVTWGNGTTGTTGVVSATNSLIGSTAGDQIGMEGVTALTNGNYVVSSRLWDNGATTDVGAVTWGNGTTGISGPVSTTNSLFGATSGDSIGSGGVTPLTNGNYVVSSPVRSFLAATNTGAVTWGNGTTGITGFVSFTNSLIGNSINDLVGNGGVTALTNGNYVVVSNSWNNGAAARAGAVTWGNGTTGTLGSVLSVNSLVGSSTDDQVGIGGVTALTNGNYVVGSPRWSGADVGAATWGNGTTGITGTISAANSLIGSTTDDTIGAAEFSVPVPSTFRRIKTILPLPNGNYVVGSPNWDGTAVDVGAATFGDGTSGTSGIVSATNSLVGSTANDRIGLTGSTINDFAFAITALPTSNYVLESPSWDNGGVGDSGAVSLMNGNLPGFAPLASDSSKRESSFNLKTRDSSPNSLGPVTMSNSVRGLAANGGSRMNFAYIPTTGCIAVGRPAENIVTLFCRITPTAADVSIAGKVQTSIGRGISRVFVSITDSTGQTRTVPTNQFGYFKFENVQAGETYVLNARAKGYSFSGRILYLKDEITDLIITPNE